MDNWNDCLLRLGAGDFTAWPRHEDIRTGNPEFKDRFVPTPDFGKPVWDGSEEPIRLLVNADFGMGDTIFFYRFLKEARRRVASLVLRCDEDFVGLLEGAVPKDVPVEFDKVIHMMALPRLVSGEAGPYLKPVGSHPHVLFDRIRSIKGFKVGLCWSGNPFNPVDSVRSFSPDVLLGIGGTFSLNKLGVPPEWLVDLRPLMGNWNETAHLISCMDLVVSCDTAVAHLAGAMGVPVWLLVPKEPDWRWRSGERWYETMKIFRQTSDWDEVVSRIRMELKG